MASVLQNGRSLGDYIQGLLPERKRSLPGSAYWKDHSNKTAVINNITTATGVPILTRKNFMQVLESWESALPLQSLWMVFFRVPTIVTDEIMGAWGEHIVKFDMDTGGVNTAQRVLNKDKFQTLMGCAFAQTVQLPPEQVTIDQVGIPNSRGFLPGPVINQRQRFASLNIEFLETNISFVDFLIRPWTVLASHFGAVARPKSEKITADIMLINFSRAGTEFNYKEVPSTSGKYTDYVPQNERGFVPRKIWMFSDCMPITVATERYSHTTDSVPDRRDTEWTFRRYQILLPSQFESTFNWIDEVPNIGELMGGPGGEMSSRYPSRAIKTSLKGFSYSMSLQTEMSPLGLSSIKKFGHEPYPRNVSKHWYGPMAYRAGETSYPHAMHAWWAHNNAVQRLRDFPPPPSDPKVKPHDRYGATLKKLLKFKAIGSRTDILSILGL